MKTVHLFLGGNAVVEVVILVHVLVETFLGGYYYKECGYIGRVTMQWISWYMFKVPTYPEPSGIATPVSVRP